MAALGNQNVEPDISWHLLLGQINEVLPAAVHRQHMFEIEPS